MPHVSPAFRERWDTTALDWGLLVDEAKAFVRAAPIAFGPRTLHGKPGQVWRTWGNPSGSPSFVTGKELLAGESNFAAQGLLQSG